MILYYLIFYSNQLKICNIDMKSVKTIDLPSEIDSNNPNVLSKKIDNIKTNNRLDQTKNGVDREERVLHCTWHPINNSIAVAGKTGICLYKA